MASARIWRLIQNGVWSWLASDTKYATNSNLIQIGPYNSVSCTMASAANLIFYNMSFDPKSANEMVSDTKWRLFQNGVCYKMAFATRGASITIRLRSLSDLRSLHCNLL